MESRKYEKGNGAWCGAIACKNSKEKRPELSFHRFPSDPQRCKQWVQNSRRQDLIGKSPAYLHENVRICSEHFESSQRHDGSNRVKRNAVPTVFDVPNPPRRVQVKRPLTTRCEPQPKRIKQELNPDMDWSGLQWLTDDVADTAKENEDPDHPGPQPNSSEKSAANTVNRLRCKVRRLKLKVEAEKEKKTEAETVQPAVSAILKATSTILPKTIQSFLGLQLKLATLPPQARRYTEEELTQALSLYYQGPRAYRQLRKRFFLPSPRALRRRLELVQLNPGLHPMIMSLLREKCRGAQQHERLVVLSFDEMQVRPKLTYLPGQDRAEGFEDLGELGRTERPADHAMVFMARGMTTKWKQPIGYFMSCGSAPARVIQPLLVSAVRQLREAGFVVAATVCDMGTPNQDLYRKLGVTRDCPKFLVDGVPVTALHDVPHLFKCVRNGLLKHDIYVDGERLSWAHVRKLHEVDRDRPIRAAPKLTSAHLQPDAFKKMKVKLATQVMSQSTAAGMLMYSSVGLLPSDVIPTANALGRLNNIFDVLNSSTRGNANQWKRALSSQNERDQIALLQDARAWISRWRIGDGVKVDFISGLQMTITAVLDIWTSLRETTLAFLLTRRLNQDGLENMFGIIRMCNGLNDRPDPTQFRHAYRKSTASRILTAPVTANYEADGDSLLGVLSSVARRVSQPASSVRVSFTEGPRVVNEVQVDAAMENCLAYVAGYLARKSLEGHDCDQCRDAMCCPERLSGAQRDILTALKSVTGVSSTDVGSLLRPTDALFGLVRESYVTTQAQAPTILPESGIARRIVTCVMHSAEATRLRLCMCGSVLMDVVARFVRLQLHVMCRRAGTGRGRGRGAKNRKLLKVSGR